MDDKATSAQLMQVMTKTQQSLEKMLKGLSELITQAQAESKSIENVQKFVKKDNIGVATSVDNMNKSYASLIDVLHQLNKSAETMKMNATDVIKSVHSLMTQKKPDINDGQQNQTSGTESSNHQDPRSEFPSRQ